jgi:hypothetical protein
MAIFRLSHPLYLDVQMMVSFLAYLEGGVFTTAEETTQTEISKEKNASGSAKFKLPSLASLLGLEASVSGDASRKSAETAETKVARHHTAASLFNGLYQHLTTGTTLHKIESAEDLHSLKTGDFVEVSGRYTGNPLEQTLDLMNSFLDYMRQIAERDNERNRSSSNARRSNNPQRREAASLLNTDDSDYVELAQQYRTFERSFEFMMVQKMREEIESSPIHDVVLKTSSDLRVILTVSSEYYSPSVAEHLTSGDFTAVGKVTRVLKSGESINLSRRTIIGKLGDDADQIATSITDSIPQITQLAGSPVVEYPALQVLPMAIFV